MKKLLPIKLVLVITLVFVLILTQMGVSSAEVSPTQELFGHVILVEGYALPSYTGCHALIALRDTPGTTIAVMTTDARLQSLLEKGLATGNLVACWAQKITNPTSPRGGTWSLDVYNTDGVILYNMK